MYSFCMAREPRGLKWHIKSISVSVTCAVPSTAVQFVTVITHTAEHPWKVLARSEHTDVLEIALVYVCGKDGKTKGTV